MQIERLSREEWARLKRIRLDALRDAPQAFGTTLEAAQGWSDDVWRQQVEDLPSFVANIEATDVGIIRGAPKAPFEDAELISLWVSPNERGRFVGERLVEAVIEWARSARFKRLVLNVADNNRPAIALYERLGFLPTGAVTAFSPPRAHITEHCRARVL